MSEGVTVPRVVRFGIFEVNPRTGEVRKQGLRVRLQEQPFQILAMLLERPGEMVTREELRKKLWPDEAFGDFDNSLNKAINRIREVLGDTAENPRFVETLPRRGYRFIGQVNCLTPDSNPALAPASDRSGATREGPTATEAALYEPPRPPAIAAHRDSENAGPQAAPLSHRPFVVMLAGACIIVLVVFGYLVTRPLPPPRILQTVQITTDGLPKFSLCTDGSQLYFQESSAGKLTLARVSAAGGDTVPLATPFRGSVSLLDISPNGSELLVTSPTTVLEGKGPLWILPAVGGSPRRLGNLEAAFASWSPDGAAIAYAKGREIYWARNDGTGSRKVVTVPGPVGCSGQIRWSRDGSALRFSAVDPQTASPALWEVSVDGTNMHLLFPRWNNPSQEFSGDWTQDGRYFVFDSVRNRVSNIWAIREGAGLFEKASREPTQLTTGPMSTSAPVVSRDGKRIFVIGQEPRGELVRYDSKSEQFLPYLAGSWADHLAFSRDAQWVTYDAYPEVTLWRSRVDGSERLQLTSPPMLPAEPVWSPDGKQIAFMGQLPGRPWKIYLVSANGGSPEELLPETRNEGNPGWSPDGSSLVFGRIPQIEGGALGQGAIQLIDVKTRAVSTLPDSEGLVSPRWSLDGRRIAATTVDASVQMLFDFSTQKWTQLARAYGCFNRWSRDGKYIYFMSNLGSEFGISRVRISDRKLERVLTPKFEWGSGVYNSWFGLSPDGSLLITRTVGVEDIYALDWEAR